MIVKLNSFFNRIFSYVPGHIFGILSTIVGFGGNILAILCYSGYTLDLMISILGTGPGALFFNLGTIFSGILALPLYFYIIQNLSKENLNKILIQAALISAVVSCIFFILIGIFPSYENNAFFLYAHGISALICFISGGVYISLFSYLFLKSSQFSNLLAYIGYFHTGLITLFLFTWIPLTEWFMTVGIIIWILSVSFYMIYKKM